MAGDLISSLFLPDMNKKMRYGIWVRLASAFGIGVLTVTWLVYFAAWGFYRLKGFEHPLTWANCVVLGALFEWLLIRGVIRWAQKRPVISAKGISRPGKTRILLFAILLLFTAFIMFYTFHVQGRTLFSGLTVFGDYAPHTAMIRSFSRENNYPTQYPHFGNEDVRYHFMFQFLVGNLEYLGLRIDLAYNLVSILSLAFFVVMLCALTEKLGGRLKGAVFTAVFFFFRSGVTFFRFAFEHARAGDLLETLKTNTVFIGYTPNENWGLWCLNVYLNQRHLAFGLLIGSIVIWTCLEWLEKSTEIRAAVEGRPPVPEITRLFFTKEAWMCRNPEKAMFLGILLGMTTFWNGAAVIGVLLILAGFGLFSENKLDYFLLACAAVFASVMQSRIFIWGSSISPVFQFGFISEDKSLLGVLWYLIQISGFFFVGLVLIMPACRKLERKLIVSFLIPVIFAFCFSLTPDINVNHKYIMIAYAFLTVIWGILLSRLFSRSWTGRLMAAVLSVCLTLTGLYDFVVILKDNGPGHEVGVNLDSELTAWLNENLDSDDLLLTPHYSMNDVTMSGVMLYCGWPYYAWSAGYDTYYRSQQQQLMYSTDQVNTLKELVRQEGITYIIYEDGMNIEGKECREDTIARAFPLVFDFGYIRVYEVTE